MGLRAHAAQTKTRSLLWDGPVCVDSPSWEAMAAAATGGDTAVWLWPLFVCGTCFSAGASATQPAAAAAAAAAARDVNSAGCAAVIRAAGYMTPSRRRGAGGGGRRALPRRKGEG